MIIGVLGFRVQNVTNLSLRIKLSKRGSYFSVALGDVRDVTAGRDVRVGLRGRLDEGDVSVDANAW